MSQYKSIAGVKYERDLLEFAEREAAQSGTSALPQTFAVSLWDMAMDGGKVTECERRTIQKIMQEHKLAAAATKYLDEHLAHHSAKATLARKGSSQYYRTIEGVRYDNGLLKQAEEMASQGPITRTGAAKLWAKAHDGNRVTETEKRTLLYIGATFEFARGAETFLSELVNELNTSVPAISSGPVGQVRAMSALPSSSGAQASTTRGLVQTMWNKALSLFTSGAPVVSDLPALPPAESITTQSSKRLREESHGSTSAPASKAPRLESGRAQSITDATTGLSSELSALLTDSADSSQPLALEFPMAVAPEEVELQRQKVEAQKEVDRILGESKVANILGHGSKADQQREFKRLTLLLHPDKGLVAADDDRATLALRLVIASRNKIMRQAA